MADAQDTIVCELRVLRGMALDQLSGDVRARVLKIQTERQKSARSASEAIVDYMLGEQNRSPLLRDPAARAIAEERRNPVELHRGHTARSHTAGAHAGDQSAEAAATRTG